MGDSSTTCHLFRLPLELRVQIWSLTAFERKVRVNTITSPNDQIYTPFPWGRSTPSDPVVHVRSSVYYPPIMHVCREARRYAPFTKAFTIGSDPRHTWVNFEKDMIQISHHSIRDPAIQPYLPLIQRFSITVHGDDNTYSEVDGHFGSIFPEFPLLREIHLIDEGCGFLRWDEETEWGHCPAGNVRIIDMHTGLMLTPQQMRMMSDFRMYHQFDTNPDASQDAEPSPPPMERSQYGDWVGCGFMGYPWSLEDDLPELWYLHDVE